MVKTLSDRFRVGVLGLMTFCVCGFVAAQDEVPEFYGTASTNYHYLSAEEFQSSDSDDYRRTQYGFWRCAPTAHLDVVASLRLPSGALVDGYAMIFNDSETDANIQVWLSRHWVTPIGAGTSKIGPTFMSSGTPGITTTWVDVDPDFTISYFNAATLATQSYVFTVTLDCWPDLSFRGIIVHWKRQISPEPAVATFADVPVGAFGFRHIEALASSGITAGCGGGNFCPNNTLTRAQMAVFLAKALGLHWAP